MSDTEERNDQGHFDEQDGQEGGKVEQDGGEVELDLASDEEFQERQSIGDEKEAGNRASLEDEEEAGNRVSLEDEEETGNRVSLEDEENTRDRASLEDEEERRDRVSLEDEEENIDDRESFEVELDTRDSIYLQDGNETQDRGSFEDEEKTRDHESLEDEEINRDHGSFENEEETQDRESLEDEEETRDRENLDGKPNTQDQYLQDEKDTRDCASLEDENEKDAAQTNFAERAEQAERGYAKYEKEDLQEELEKCRERVQDTRFKTFDIEKESERHDRDDKGYDREDNNRYGREVNKYDREDNKYDREDNRYGREDNRYGREDNGYDEKDLKTSEFEAPASFIIHDSVSANNHGSQSYSNRFGTVSKVFDTQDSYETGSKRDEVFHDDGEAGREFESRKKLDHAMVDKFQSPSTTEASEAVVVKDVPSGTVSEKLEKFQEKVKSSQSTTPSHPAAVSSHGGKLRDGRIEMFEMLKKGTPETEAKTRPAVDVSVVSKGRAIEIKEKIEQGKWTARDVEASSTDGHATHESTIPPQGTRKKIADDWMTKIKSANQTTPEAKVHATVPHATNVSAIRDNFWKRREETLNKSSDRQSDQTEEGRPALVVGKLKLKEKEAIFGGTGDKTQSSDPHTVSGGERGPSSEVKRTPSYTYRSYRGENGSTTTTPNVVSFTKSGVVKTDTRVELSARSSNALKNDPYRTVDRQGLIKTIDGLKKRIENLENENENLKNSLNTTRRNDDDDDDDDDGGNDEDNNNCDTIPEPTKPSPRSTSECFDLEI